MPPLPFVIAEPDQGKHQWLWVMSGVLPVFTSDHTQVSVPLDTAPGSDFPRTKPPGGEKFALGSCDFQLQSNNVPFPKHGWSVLNTFILLRLNCYQWTAVWVGMSGVCVHVPRSLCPCVNMQPSEENTGYFSSMTLHDIFLRQYRSHWPTDWIRLGVLGQTVSILQDWGYGHI